MIYPKKFEKWYNKNYANRGIFGYGRNEESFKFFMYEAWRASAKKIAARMKKLHKAFDGSWQHEDIEYCIEDIEKKHAPKAKEE